MMNAAATHTTDETAASEGSPPSQLASHLAAKLCHDFASPAGAMVNGLDMMRDPDHADMRDDLLAMVESSARKLLAMVHFDRVAYGAATSSESFSSEEIETLAQSVFEGIRPDLEWTCDIERFGKPQARAALNLAQIAGGALAVGGTVKFAVAVDEGRLSIKAKATGPRARLKQEVMTGLSGETLTDGLAGQWIQAFWLHATVSEADGDLTFETAEDRVDFAITMPL